MSFVDSYNDFYIKRIELAKKRISEIEKEILEIETTNHIKSLNNLMVEKSECIRNKYYLEGQLIEYVLEFARTSDFRNCLNLTIKDFVKKQLEQRKITPYDFE